MRWVVGLTIASMSICYGTITWTTKTPLPQSLAGSGCAVINDTVYVIGGRDSGGARYKTNYIYDAGNDSWSTRTEMPTARAHIGAAIVGGKIYVFGGWVGSTASNVVEEYDPISNSWTTKANMPTPRYGYCVATYADKIYVIGGMDMNGNVFNTVEEYDPANNSWSTKTPMPTQRMGPGCAVLGNKIYVFGGSTNIGGGATTVCESYDPVNNSWQSEVSMSFRRYALGGFAFQGKAYAIGGYDYSIYHTTVEVYESGGWSLETPMQYARQSVAVGLVNNNVYIIGGWNNGAWNYNEEGSITISVEEERIVPDMKIEIGPNPFRDVVKISVGSQDLVSVKVFDSCGRMVRDLFQGFAPCSISWDGRGADGERLPNGVYLLLVNGKEKRETKVLNLIR